MGGSSHECGSGAIVTLGQECHKCLMRGGQPADLKQCFFKRFGSLLSLFAAKPNSCGDDVGECLGKAFWKRFQVESF